MAQNFGHCFLASNENLQALDECDWSVFSSNLAVEAVAVPGKWDSRFDVVPE